MKQILNENVFRALLMGSAHQYNTIARAIERALAKEPIRWGKSVFKDVGDVDKVLAKIKANQAMPHEVRMQIVRHLDNPRIFKSISDELAQNSYFISRMKIMSEPEAIENFIKQGYSDTQIKQIINSYKGNGGTFVKETIQSAPKPTTAGTKSKNTKKGLFAKAAKYNKDYVSIYKALRTGKATRIIYWLAYGTTRSPMELFWMFKNGGLKVGLFSLGRELMVRWIKLTFYITLGRFLLHEYQDSKTEGREYNGTALENLIHRIWDALYFPELKWVFPAGFVWGEVFPRLKPIYDPILSGATQEEVAQGVNVAVTNMINEFKSDKSESLEDLYNYAGSLKKHIHGNLEDGYYLGTPDYPIYYDDKSHKVFVLFPDGKVYDLKNIQE